MLVVLCSLLWVVILQRVCKALVFDLPLEPKQLPGDFTAAQGLWCSGMPLVKPLLRLPRDCWKALCGYQRKKLVAPASTKYMSFSLSRWMHSRPWSRLTLSLPGRETKATGMGRGLQIEEMPLMTLYSLEVNKQRLSTCPERQCFPYQQASCLPLECFFKSSCPL